MDLRSYIGEVEWRDLLDARQRAVPIARGTPQPGRFQALWADWELDAICRFTLLPESETFRLFKDGKQVPAVAYRDRRGSPSLTALRQLWASGVSINFARLELFSNPILALTRELEAALRTPARFHFFTTPRQAQGLGVHADHSDVLVLQLQGEKTWDIYRTAPAWRVGAPDKDIALKGHAPDTVTLVAGGWLYLPYGVYHEVRNKSDVPSTHVTIGFHSLTWRALIERALEFSKGKASSLDQKVDVSRPLAVDEDDVSLRLSALRPFLEIALEADKYGNLLPPEALTSRPVLEAVHAGTRFVWQQGRVESRALADRIELNLPYRTVPLKLSAEFAPAIERMAGRPSITPADLPHEMDTALLLCKFLANVGVLRCADDASESA